MRRYAIAIVFFCLLAATAYAAAIIIDNGAIVIGASNTGVVPHPNDPRPYDDVLLFVFSGSDQNVYRCREPFNPLHCWQMPVGSKVNIKAVQDGSSEPLVDSILLRKD